VTGIRCSVVLRLGRVPPRIWRGVAKGRSAGLGIFSGLFAVIVTVQH
jgi:hypothetical protein